MPLTCRRASLPVFLPLELFTEARRVFEHANHRISCLKLLNGFRTTVLGVSEHGLDDFAASAGGLASPTLLGVLGLRAHRWSIGLKANL